MCIFVQRAALLESLSKHQIDTAILSKFTPITEVLTKGRKRLFDHTENSSNDVTCSAKKWKVTGGKRAQKFRIDNKPKFSDPNIVGFSVSFYICILFGVYFSFSMLNIFAVL